MLTWRPEVCITLWYKDSTEQVSDQYRRLVSKRAIAYPGSETRVDKEVTVRHFLIKVTLLAFCVLVLRDHLWCEAVSLWHTLIHISTGYGPTPARIG